MDYPGHSMHPKFSSTHTKKYSGSILCSIMLMKFQAGFLCLSARFFCCAEVFNDARTVQMVQEGQPTPSPAMCRFSNDT